MKKKDDSIKIKQYVEFAFTYKQNADNVALALATSGYYIKVSYDSSMWTVRIYTDRI